MTTKSMAVRVGADTGEMERKLSSAQKRIKAFRTSINQIGKRMAVAGAAVAAAAGLMVKKYVEVGDQVDKMRKRTGFSAESLSELSYAAEICGADLGLLEKGVKRMAKTITDADEGMATYIRSFDRMGIKVKDIKNLKPEEQFRIITEALAELGDETVQAATAQDIFGRAGTMLLPLMKEGKEGIRKLREEAHRLGIVFDEEAAAKAAAFKDSQTALKKSIQGVGFAVAKEFMPLLTSLAQHFTDVFVNVRSNTKSFVGSILGFLKILGQGIVGLGLAWTGFKGLVFKIAEYAGKIMKAQIDIITAPLKLLAKIPGKLGEPARLMLKEVGKLTGALTIITDSYNESAENQVDTMADMIEKYDKFIEMLNDVGGSLDRLKTKTSKTTAAATEDLGELAGALDLGPAFKIPDFTLAEQEFSTFKEFLAAWLEDLKERWNSAWQAALDGARNVTNAMDAVFGQFHDNQAKRLENEEKQQTDAIEAWFERERSRLEATIENEEAKVAALEALDEEKARRENELAHKMDKERRKLERSRAKSQKVTALFSAGINVAEAITKALTAGPLIGQILAGIVAGLGMIQVAAIAAAPLPALAKGGRIGREGGIVGEKGIELFVPDRPGTIVPLNRGAVAGAGAFSFSPVVNIYPRNLDDRTINRSAERIFAALERERRRRGY